VPQQLLSVAEEKLQELEGSGVSIDMDNYVSSISEAEIDPKAETEQISFFSFAPNPVVERLKTLDLMNITPSQAFGILEELKKAADNT
jgi:DNA mismatch repair protein MutS